MDEKKYMIQDFTPVEASELLDTVASLKEQGYRLGQACCTTLEDHLEVLYSFDKDHVLHNLKLCLPKVNPEVMSITGIIWSAFIYENEIHDLFGVTFKHSELDYGGNFFRIAEKTPWNKDACAVSAEEPAEAVDEEKAIEQ
jgi:ech hydrogenase subunit D